MAQIVLADEINRATPKTQSALLECMEERQVTVDGVTYPMPDPFLVIATQNPIEYEGTFALPEAQLDRFMLRIRLGYPAPLEEIVILDEQKRSHPLDELGEVVAGRGAAARCRPACARSTSTRRSPTTSCAWSTPRATTRTSTSAPRRAARSPCTAPARRSPRSHGRDYVIPDDIKVAGRAGAGPSADRRARAATIRDVEPGAIVRELLDAVPVEARGAAVRTGPACCPA